VLRPVRFPVSALNRSLLRLVRHSDYVQDARKNQQAWEERFAGGQAVATPE
jgi:ornithine lipid ester-linked acyl 2-hydroxylase